MSSREGFLEMLDALHFDESAADGTAVEATATVRTQSDFGLPITMLSCAAQVSELTWFSAACVGLVLRNAVAPSQTRACWAADRRSVADFSVVIRFKSSRSEERRVGKECRSRWSPY